MSSRRIEKVYKADDYSSHCYGWRCWPLSGNDQSSSRSEMEHYHKIEGRRSPLTASANKLAQMVEAKPAGSLSGAHCDSYFLLAMICACSRAVSLSMT